MLYVQEDIPVNVFRKKPSKIHFFFQNNQWLSNVIELKRDDKGNGKKGGGIKKEKSKSYILSSDNDVWGNWSILNKTGIKVLMRCLLIYEFKI